MEQGHVYSSPINREVLEEAVRVRGGAVGRTPHREPVGHSEGGQLVVGEHVNIGSPLLLHIHAVRPYPVVVARGDKDGHVEGCKQ